MEADPGGQPGTGLEVTHKKPSCMYKYRFFKGQDINSYIRIICGTWRPLDADPGGRWRLILEAVMYRFRGHMQ